MKTLFKRTILLLLLIYFVGCNSTNEKAINENKSQNEASQKEESTNENKLNKLKFQLQNADSILLVSHEQTYGPIFNKKGDSYIEAKRIVEDGIVNKKVINKTALIEGKEKENLINILTQEVKGEVIDLATCFDPHHALIIISKKDISHIEFCFTCGGVSTDKLEISSADFDKEKWDKIYKYIDSKIPIKE